MFIDRHVSISINDALRNTYKQNQWLLILAEEIVFVFFASPVFCVHIQNKIRFFFLTMQIIYRLFLKKLKEITSARFRFFFLPVNVDHSRIEFNKYCFDRETGKGREEGRLISALDAVIIPLCPSHLGEYFPYENKETTILWASFFNV